MSNDGKALIYAIDRAVTAFQAEHGNGTVSKITGGANVAAAMKRWNDSGGPAEQAAAWKKAASAPGSTIIATQLEFHLDSSLHPDEIGIVGVTGERLVVYASDA